MATTNPKAFLRPESRIHLPVTFVIVVAVFGPVLGALAGCAGLPDPEPECPVSFAHAADLGERGELLKAAQAYRELLSEHAVYPDGMPARCIPVFAAGKAGYAGVLRQLEDRDGAAAAYREAHRIASEYAGLETERRVWQLAAVELELDSGADVADLREELFEFAPLPGHDGPKLETALFAAWGALMQRQAELDLAVSMYETAAERAAELDRAPEAARILRRKAAARVLQRNDEAALELYLEALSFAERSGNRALEAELHRELGRSLARLGELDGAEWAWERALAIYEKLNRAPRDRVADIEFDLAVLFELDGSRGNASHQYRRALESYKDYFEQSASSRVPEGSRRHAEIVRRYEAARFRLGEDAAATSGA